MKAADIVDVLIKREGDDIPFPVYMTEGAAGVDLHAAEDCELRPMEFRAVSTGIRIALPSGYEAQIRPRSGLAAKFGITVLNSPGTVDSDYRGEIRVILINLGRNVFHVRKGDRIAQMVIQRVSRVKFVEVDALPGTERGEGGFGYTGI